MKSRRVFIKTRSTPASLPLKGQVTKYTTVKRTIVLNSLAAQSNILNKGGSFFVC